MLIQCRVETYITIKLIQMNYRLEWTEKSKTNYV